MLVEKRLQQTREQNVQYVVLGPRVKIIILNILSESKRLELKFSLKIAFMFLAMIFKWQVPKGNIFLVTRKKVTVLAGPWSANVVLGPRIMQTARKVPANSNNFSRRMKMLTIFYYSFLSLIYLSCTLVGKSL